MVSENDLHTVMDGIQAHLQDCVCEGSEHEACQFKNHHAFDAWSAEQTANQFFDEDDYVEVA